MIFIEYPKCIILLYKFSYLDTYEFSEKIRMSILLTFAVAHSLVLHMRLNMFS